jgi:hypothetical protein
MLHIFSSIGAPSLYLRILILMLLHTNMHENARMCEKY